MESETNCSVESDAGRQHRGSFTGKVGFVLAAAGSAVGLGNLWRFPYLADKFGGGAFLMTYVILMVVFGIALMATEIALGRKTGKSCIDAFRDVSEKHAFIGWLAAIVPIIITPYYCVIGGWVMKYFFEFAAGTEIGVTGAASAGFFNDFMTCNMDGILGSPVTWFLIFSVLAVIVVALGVEKGIEKVSKYLMPVLFILMIGICVYTLFLPTGENGITVMDGIKHYLVPNLDDFNSKTILGAVGQLFYSMSLAMGIMITYGSYMKKDVSITKSATQIACIDTGVAFMAGLMIIPPMFMMGAGIGSGPGLMFISLPVVFEAMPGGQIIGTLFFFLVIIAALTSAISLAETVASMFHDRLHWTRKVSSTAVMAIILGLGILSCLGYGPLDMFNINGEMFFLDIFDALSNNILMPIVAILTCLFVGYVVKPKFITDEFEECGHVFKYKTPYEYLIKFVCPIILVAVLITGLLATFGIWKI